MIFVDPTDLALDAQSSSQSHLPLAVSDDLSALPAASARQDLSRSQSCQPTSKRSDPWLQLALTPTACDPYGISMTWADVIGRRHLPETWRIHLPTALPSAEDTKSKSLGCRCILPGFGFPHDFPTATQWWWQSCHNPSCQPEGLLSILPPVPLWNTSMPMISIALLARGTVWKLLDSRRHHWIHGLLASNWKVWASLSRSKHGRGRLATGRAKTSGCSTAWCSGAGNSRAGPATWTKQEGSRNIWVAMVAGLKNG